VPTRAAALAPRMREKCFLKSVESGSELLSENVGARATCALVTFMIRQTRVFFSITKWAQKFYIPVPREQKPLIAAEPNLEFSLSLALIGVKAHFTLTKQNCFFFFKSVIIKTKTV
jgi:hypothetical protein